jgi:predicted ribosomally synthesized peptide with nif11-like leader
MSKAFLDSFILRMKTDAAFADRILAEADPAARLELIRAEGYDFSAGEIEAEASRLEDGSLEAVAGGAGLHCLQVGGYRFGTVADGPGANNPICE